MSNSKLLSYSREDKRTRKVLYKMYFCVQRELDLNGLVATLYFRKIEA